MLAYGAFKRPPSSADTCKKVMGTSQLQGWLMGKTKAKRHVCIRSTSCVAGVPQVLARGAARQADPSVLQQRRDHAVHCALLPGPPVRYRTELHAVSPVCSMLSKFKLQSKEQAKLSIAFFDTLKRNSGSALLVCADCR